MMKSASQKIGRRSLLPRSSSFALSAMVCRLTVNKKQYAAVKDELTEVRDKADVLRKELVVLVETDKKAFDKVMAALKLSGDEKSLALEAANKGAAGVPLVVMKKSLEVLRLVKPVAQKGNQNSLSDAGVAGLMAMASVEGAFYNVKINLAGVADKSFTDQMRREAQQVHDEARKLADEIRAIVESKL